MSDENVSGGQKRRKASNVDDDSTSNRSASPEPLTKKNRVSYSGPTVSNSTMDGDTVPSTFQLVITNLPGGWTCDQVMNYVREEIGENALLVNDFRDTDSDFQIRLKFKTAEQRNKVLEKLKIKQALGLVCVDTEGKTEDLASDEDVSSKSDMRVENRDIKGQDLGTNISIDVWDVDPKTLYGLKESFLTSLDITPPLSNWVLVTNFRCDRSELKEVLELAGHVVVCHVVTVAKRYANVMYSHPLEAVQAISMLNGQTYYGQILKISMDNQSEYWKILPKGLANLGPGLGKYGKPVRNIAKEYERFISGKSTFIETKIFKSEKSSDLLKEIILTSLSRPNSRTNDTPELVIDTQRNEHNVKDESPKKEIETANNDSSDLENQEHTDSEITGPNVKVNNFTSDNTIESTNGTHVANNNNQWDGNATFNEPITNFGQNSAAINGQMVRPFNEVQSGTNPGPYRPTDLRTQNIGSVGFQGMQGGQSMRGVQGMQDPLSMQGMQRIRGPQPMQSMQSMQGVQGMQGIQGTQGPQEMQGMQGNQGMQRMQGMQGIQSTQGPQSIQGMQGNQGMQRMQGMQGIQGTQGPQAIQGMQGNQGMQRMQGMQGMQGLQGSQPMQGMQGNQSMQRMQVMQRQMGPRAMQHPFQQNLAQFENNHAFGNQGSSQPYYPTQMSGNGYLNSGIQGTMQAPVMQPNVPTRPVGPFAQQQSVRPLEIYRGMNAFTLKIINIPAMIKLSALCDKLSEFGQVTGLEFDGPGAAMVKYESAGDAERCFRNYRQVFQY